MRPTSRAWDRFCAEVGQLRRDGRLSEQQLEQLGQQAERLYDAGWLSEDQVLKLTEALLSPEDLALIDGIAYGLARLFKTPLGQLAAEAGVQPRSPHWMTGDEVSETIARSAARFASTPLDQLAAEAHAHRTSRDLLDMPGHAGSGVVLQNPHDAPAHWYAMYQVDWLRGYPIPDLPPTIDGYPVKINVVDSLPVPYA
jgi:hypothetical protein